VGMRSNCCRSRRCRQGSGTRSRSRGEQLLLNILDKGRVVFVTSFADGIRRHYDSGELGALWKDLGFSASVMSLTRATLGLGCAPMLKRAEPGIDAGDHRFLRVVGQSNRARRPHRKGRHSKPRSCAAYRTRGIRSASPTSTATTRTVKSWITAGASDYRPQAGRVAPTGGIPNCPMDSYAPFIKGVECQTRRITSCFQFIESSLRRALWPSRIIVTQNDRKS